MMCFTFGAGLPIMFVFGLIALTINYFVSAYSLAYVYKNPIRYGNIINKNFIKNCELLPLFYGAIGFWMYSNRQIFENAIEPIDFQYSVINHQHTIVQSLTTINPGTPFLILIVYQIAYINGFRFFFPGEKLKKYFK